MDKRQQARGGPSPPRDRKGGAMTSTPYAQLAADLDVLIRPLAEGSTPAAEETVPTVVDALVRAGWVTPPELLREWVEQLGSTPEDLMTAIAEEPAVRSLSEDLAVERLRQQRLLASAAATHARAAAALERSAALSAAMAAERRAWAAAATAQLTQNTAAAPPVSGGCSATTSVGRAAAAPSPCEAELLAELEQLRYALRNRPPLEHAVGMVMLVLSCDAQTAWEALAALSQQTNQRVRHIAEAMRSQAERGELRPEHLAAVLAGLHPAAPGEDTDHEGASSLETARGA